MRQIERTTQFRRDFRKASKKPQSHLWLPIFRVVLETLCQDRSLPEKYRDHQLVGSWRDHRDCHIRPDLVLIYRLPDAQVIQLVRLGSHSELGLT